MVLEYCEGRNLLEVLIEDGKLPEKMVQEVMKQLLSALVYLETKNIVHRFLENDFVLI